MMLKDLFYREKFVYDFEFDWNILNLRRIEEQQARYGEGDYRAGEAELAVALRTEYTQNPENQKASDHIVNPNG